jgi:hypothetical protein
VKSVGNDPPKTAAQVKETPPGCNQPDKLARQIELKSSVIRRNSLPSAKNSLIPERNAAVNPTITENNLPESVSLRIPFVLPLLADIISAASQSKDDPVRLTLRTLLAYLDDRLPPANAREIGQKISKSPFATELTERIRDVVRKRRLAAPEKPAPMIDANLVAEYLDDQLTPELVARIEREILQSDVALAEVAATHEILGLLREPVALEPRLRDRLYALDPSGQLDVVQKLSGSSASTPAPGSSSAAPEWKPLATRPASSRRIPLIIVSVLALVWIAVLFTDSSLFNDGSPDLVASREADRPEDDGSSEGKDAANAENARNDQSSNAGVRDAATAMDSEKNTADAFQSTAVAVPDVIPSASDDPVVSDIGKSAPPVDVAGTDNVTRDDADNIGIPEPVTLPSEAAVNGRTTPQPVAEDPTPVDKDMAAKIPAADENLSVYPLYLTDEFQMSLVLNETRSEWVRAVTMVGKHLPADQLRLRDWRGTLQSRWIGVPLPWQTQIVVSGSGWRCMLTGPAVAQVINRQESGLWISEGRAIVSRDTAAEIADDAPITFRLQTGLSTSPLVLMTSDTRLAVEVFPEPARAGRAPLPPAPAPVSAEPGEADDSPEVMSVSEIPRFADTDFLVRLYVVQGRVQIPGKPGENPSELLKAQGLSWKVLSTGEITNVAIVAASPQNALPEWIFRAGATPIPEQTSIMQHVSSLFAADENLTRSILQLSKDRNPQAGVLAVNVATLTRDVETLSTILMESSEEIVRQACIDGLALVAAQSPSGQELLQRALETRLPMSEVSLFMSLIIGVSEQDARNPEFCQQLLALLSNDRPATRQLAVYRMQQFTGDRFGYSVDADPGRRREAVRRWQRYIERNDGKLLP